MKISEALQLQHKKPCVIAFVGAGGKTTCMFRLAEELKEQGRSVLVTTTTKIYYPETRHYDKIIIQSNVEIFFQEVVSAVSDSVIVAAKEFRRETEKLKGFSPGVLDMLVGLGVIDYILVEADGSKRKPIKAPGEHEPVLPSKTDIVVGMTGFDCYNKRIDTDTVFRMNEFCQITGKSEGEAIDKETLLTLVASEKGLFKTTSTAAQRVWLLNKVDDRESLMLAGRVGRRISEQVPSLDIVMITALKQEDPVKKVFRKR